MISPEKYSMLCSQVHPSVQLSIIFLVICGHVSFDDVLVAVWIVEELCAAEWYGSLVLASVEWVIVGCLHVNRMMAVCLSANWVVVESFHVCAWVMARMVRNHESLIQIV